MIDSNTHPKAKSTNRREEKEALTKELQKLTIYEVTDCLVADMIEIQRLQNSRFNVSQRKARVLSCDTEFKLKFWRLASAKACRKA